MSEYKIRRKFKAVPITLSTSTAVATTLRWDDVAGGVVELGTVSTATSQTLQMWASESGDTPFGRLYKSDGSVADVTLAPSTVTRTAYALPDETYGCGFLKIVAGSTNTTAALAVVMLKT